MKNNKTKIKAFIGILVTGLLLATTIILSILTSRVTESRFKYVVIAL